MKQPTRGQQCGSEVTPKAAPESGRRERVLTEAARLFAMEGFHGVSMRDIAKAADVGLPLVVYHFETKQNLYRSIFDAHSHLFDERLAELRQAFNTPGPNLIERIVEAFVDPILRSQATTEGVVYSQLVAREACDPREDSRQIMSDYFDPMAREFICALRKALPDKSDGFLEWAYLFSVGALVMSVFDARISRISDDRIQPGNIAQKTKFLCSFIAAGIRGGPESTTSIKEATKKQAATKRPPATQGTARRSMGKEK